MFATKSEITESEVHTDHLQRLLYVLCPAHHDRVDRLAGKATITSGMRLMRSTAGKASTTSGMRLSHYEILNVEEFDQDTTRGRKAKDIAPAQKCVSPSLSEVFPSCLWNRSSVFLVENGTVVLTRWIVDRFLFLRLSPTGARWCT